ncbi:class I SAM-dependent methyltransferase [Pseudalkalibacillus decolorationis]|uniref:class I SAM-dependent methyltransferase n=1 Tax=Pseudalkalibacillus decolorationis TaxID=163879 RepID=UPI00214850C8|nr:SAM-dependent methyltransferase [Pseudalkalibacillus decolorationis]
MTVQASGVIPILQKKIQQSIADDISYAEFIETALYDPVRGYYRRKSDKIGSSGDFYTSSSVHPVFAWVFADYFYDYLTRCNAPYMICELGGGSGSFAKEVLSHLKLKHPEFYNELHYLYVDVSEDHLAKAQDQLASFQCVSFYQSTDKLKSAQGTINGVVFSNELLDAMPVHVVEKREGVINEVRVSIKSTEKLEEVIVHKVQPEIEEWLNWSGLNIQEGNRIEVPLKMNEWVDEMSALIESGLLVTVDYGYSNAEWQEPSHRKGSLRGYHNHQLIENPLLNPGQMDLTTHIHIDSLLKKGKEVGFTTISCTRQRDFLLEHGLFNFLYEHQNPDPFSKESRLNRAIRSFATPGGISDSFHVIVQEC